jgi:hypothetical protein
LKAINYSFKIQNNTMKKKPMEKGKGEKKVDKKIK